MHLIYIDESGDETLCVYTALALPADHWNEALAQLRSFRRELRKVHGIRTSRELHAWKFVSGRGRPSDRILTRSQRASIFRKALEELTRLPGARLFNAVGPKGCEERALERLLNRIQRSVETWGSQAILICDQGKEAATTKLVRRLRVFNPIPSRQGVWSDTGKPWRQAPLDRVLEDPVFRNSKQSYFIQMVDFAAFSLLRRESPIASRSRYGIHTAFELLGPILVREANRNDPDGIVRL